MLQINPLDFALHLVNIIVLFIVLRSLLIKPVRKFMADREAKFQKEREVIDTARADADALKAQYESSLSEARKTAEELVQERLSRAENDALEIVSNAREEARQALSKAHEQNIADRDELLGQLHDQTAILAVDLAGHILEREVSAEDNERLINDFFKKVG